MCKSEHDQKANLEIQHREFNNLTYLVTEERVKEKREKKKERERRKRESEGKEKRKGWRIRFKNKERERKKKKQKSKDEQMCVEKIFIYSGIATASKGQKEKQKGEEGNFP